jgi:hypothetical protein
MKLNIQYALIPLALLLSINSHAGVSVDVHLGVPNVDIFYNTVPPAPIVEVVPEPRVGYVWAPGYWNWSGNQHVWVHGTWIRQRPGYEWVAPRWVRGDRGWQMEQGRWMAARDAHDVWRRRHDEEERYEAMRREDYRHVEASRHDGRGEGWHEERHEERRDERDDRHEERRHEERDHDR